MQHQDGLSAGPAVQQQQNANNFQLITETPYSNGNHAAHPATTGDSSKKYVWVGNRPTCSECGDRGHSSSSCSAPYCDVCFKYGHEPGACSSACRNCGKLHKRPDCIVCKQCGMFGHLLPFCPSTHCSRCGCWGHIRKDCVVQLPEDAAAPDSTSSPNTVSQDATGPPTRDSTASTALADEAAAGAAGAAAGAAAADGRGGMSYQQQHVPRAIPTPQHAAYRQPQAAAAASPGSDGYGEGSGPYSTSYEESGQGYRQQQQQHPYQQHQQHYMYDPGYQGCQQQGGQHMHNHHHQQQQYQQQQYQQQYQPQYQQQWRQPDPYSQPQAASSSSSPRTPAEQWRGTPPVPAQQQQQSAHAASRLANTNSNNTYGRNGSPSRQQHAAAVAATDGGWSGPPRGLARTPPPRAAAVAAAEEMPAAAAAAAAVDEDARSDYSSSSSDLLALLEAHQPPPQQQPEQQQQQQTQLHPVPAHQQDQQQQEGAMDRSIRQYAWLAKLPTCWVCGDRGHEAAHCSSHVCAACGKVGHATGQCDRHCEKCGKAHTSKGCKQCRLCGMFGHLSTMCFDAHCEACNCWGHASQDCPSVCKCGYPTPHSPAECPGLCTRCLQYGHTTKDCNAQQCAHCQQWGQGCTDTHCISMGYVQPSPPPAQQQRAVPMPDSSTAAASGIGDAAVFSSNPGDSSSMARQGSDTPGPGSSFATPHSSTSSNGAPGPQQQQQQDPVGSVSVAGVLVQLECLSDAEDNRRRTQFLNWLIDSPRAEFKVFGTLLVDAPEKIAVLIRVPGALMKGRVLPRPDAVLQMERICAQVLEGSSNSGSGGSGSDGTSGDRNLPAGQLLLPEHAAEFEAALPQGLLPRDWRSLTFGKIADMVQVRPYFDNIVLAKRAFKKAKNEALAKSDAARAAGQQQQQQRPGAQQQQQQRAHNGSNSCASEWSTVGRGQGARAASESPAPHATPTASPVPQSPAVRPGTGHRGAAGGTAAVHPPSPVPSSFTPVGQPGSQQQQQQQQMLLPDFGNFRPESVQLEPPPPPDVASKRREQLAEVLLTHPNGDLHDFGLELVAQEQKFSVLIRTPWPVLEWCMGQHIAAELLDAVATKAAAGAASAVQQQQERCQRGGGRPQQQQQRRVEQQVVGDEGPPPAGAGVNAGAAVPQVVEEDDGDYEDDDWEDEQQQQQQGYRGASASAPTAEAAGRRSSKLRGQKKKNYSQQHEDAGSSNRISGPSIGPGDLLPEHAALLQQEFPSLRPGWQDARSWRDVEANYFRGSAKEGLVNSKRAYRARRQELSDLTAAALAAAAPSRAGVIAKQPAAAAGAGSGPAGPESDSSSRARQGRSSSRSRSSSSRTQGRSSSRVCEDRRRQYRELLLSLQLRDEGNAQQVAERVAYTTSQVLSGLPEYTQQLFGSGDAGPKMAFLARLQQEDLDKVLQQKHVPPGEVLDGLYEQYSQVQAGGGGELVVGQQREGGSMGKKFGRGVGARCVQS